MGGGSSLVALVVGAVGEVEEAPHKGVAPGRIAADHQERVVARDGAEDVAQVGLVEGAGEELGRARRSAEDNEVGARLGADEQLGAEPGEAFAPCSALARRDDRAVTALARHRIPYRIRTAVTEIHGTDKVEAVTMSRLTADGAVAAMPPRFAIAPDDRRAA